MHEESFDVGDRTLHAIRPPLYDSPATRGLLDPSTGIYGAVDTFATPLPSPELPVAALDPEFWEFGMTLFAFGALCPWLSLLDVEKFGRYVNTVERLDIKTVAGCHTPAIECPHIKQAFDHVRRLV